LGIKRFKPVSRRTNHIKGIRTLKCLELLHANINEFKTADNKNAYIYLIIDNYSGGILAWHISYTGAKQVLLLKTLPKFVPST
jgi:hypothetical protein